MVIHANNFDTVRLVAALLVLVSHQFALSGNPEPGIGAGTLGSFGVKVFFTISGYLIAQSWTRDQNAMRYWIKRAARIGPALLVVLVLQEALLPMGFPDNPVQAVNGSLWTIAIEVRWYLILFVLGITVGLNRATVFTATIIYGVYAAYVIAYNPNAASVAKVSYGTCFLIGMCLNHIQGRYLWAFIAAIAWTLYALEFRWASEMALSSLAVFIGRSSGPRLPFGDISYGVYLYAFPIQQFVIFTTHNTLSPYLGICASIALTLPIAYLSWHFVEHPCLSLARTAQQFRFRRVTS